MSLYTSGLNLFKWNTSSSNDLNENFDLDKAVNENWEKIDAGYIELKNKTTELESDKANSGDVYLKTTIDTLLENKVDKVTGKSLSTNDYTTAEKNKLSGIADEANKTIVDSVLSSTSTNPIQNKVIYLELENKVDKVTGKALSTNDFTDAYKAKLESLANYDDTDLNNSISALQNNKVDKVTGKELSTNDYTTAEKTKLANLENYDDTAITTDISSLKNNKVDKVIGKELSTNDFTNEYKERLDNLIPFTSTEIEAIFSKYYENGEAVS